LENYNSDEKSVWNYNTTSVINVDKLNNFDRGEGSKVIMANENGQVESVTNEQVTERLEEIRGTSSSNDSDTNSKKMMI